MCPRCRRRVGESRTGQSSHIALHNASGIYCSATNRTTLRAKSATCAKWLPTCITRAGRRRRMHGIRCRLDSQEGAATGSRLRCRRRGRACGDRAQGLHAHSFALSRCGARSRSSAGRARRQIVEREILFGDDHAREDGRNHLRAYRRRRRSRGVTKSRSLGQKGIALGMTNLTKAGPSGGKASPSG